MKTFPSFIILVLFPGLRASLPWPSEMFSSWTPWPARQMILTTFPQSSTWWNTYTGTNPIFSLLNYHKEILLSKPFFPLEILERKCLVKGVQNIFLQAIISRQGNIHQSSFSSILISKAFHSTEKTLTLHNHYPWSCLGSCDILDVDPSGRLSLRKLSSLYW